MFNALAWYADPHQRLDHKALQVTKGGYLLSMSAEFSQMEFMPSHKK